MGTISEKLAYLNNTKTALKERLISLGATITNSTTFRNYLTWLDNFYNDVSNKTDISTNGIVGRTNQESTTGKNKLLITASSSRTDANVTGTYNETDGSFTISGTASSSKNAQITSTIPLELEAGTYTFSIDHVLTKQIYLHFNLTGGGTQNIAIPAGETEGTGTFSANTTGYNIRFSVANEDVYNEKIFMQLESGSSATSWEKFTFGASPNPSYEQPINNLSGNVDYTIKNKNKLKLTNQDITINGVNFKVLSNGKMLINGTATANIDGTLFTNDNYFPVDLNSGTYTLSRSETNSNVSIGLCATNGTTSIATLSRLNQNKGTSFTLNQKAYLFFYIPYGSVIDNYEVELQLETGSTATNWEQYIEPQTFTIPLGDIELAEISTYKDRIYSNNGKFYLEKQIGNIVLNGSEENWLENSVTKGLFQITLSNIYDNSTTINAISNLLIGAVKTSVISASNFIDNSISTASTNRLFFRIDSYKEDLNGLKTYLSTHNLTAYYVYATQTTTEITSSNYPELYAALKEIQDYLTSYKINKEFILGYSSPNIEY